MKKAIIGIFFLCLAMSIYTQDDFGYEDNIAVIMAENEAFENILSLWFTEAETGKPIDSASIVINGLGKYTSDKNGLIYFKIPKNGKYAFAFDKDGYVPFKDEFEVEVSTVIFNKYSVPKLLELENIKVVLDWSDKPKDLDIHLLKKSQDGYHISYRDTKRLEDGTVYLDRDDQNGYGPETITITELDDTSEYLLYIHNYSDKNNSGSRYLSESKAIVRIYNNNELVHTIKNEDSRQGIFWYVFDIKNGQINTLNKYSTE